MEFQYLINGSKSSIPSLLVGACALMYALVAFLPSELFFWKKLNRFDKIYVFSHLTGYVAMTLLGVNTITSAVGMFPLESRILFSIGISIGTAAGICCLIFGALPAIFGVSNIADIIVNNLKTLLRMTALVSATFGGMFFGIFMYNIAPQSWPSSIEGFVAVFFACLLCVWVIAVITIPFYQQIKVGKNSLLTFLAEKGALITHRLKS